jgi:hypothetical protein
MDNKKVSKLFCEKGDLLGLLFSMEIEYDGKSVHLSKGLHFEVVDIIEFGFDLRSKDSRSILLRLLNSQMANFFTVIGTSDASVVNG